MFLLLKMPELLRICFNCNLLKKTMKKSHFEQYNSNLRYLESTKFAVHIFEIAGFVIFSDYCFIKDIAK